MNEYCNHCASKFGTSNSFVGITKSGKYAHVVCSGCGITHVNHLGECQKCKYRKRSQNRGTQFVTLSLFLTFLALALIYFTYY